MSYDELLDFFTKYGGLDTIKCNGKQYSIRGGQFLSISQIKAYLYQVFNVNVRESILKELLDNHAKSTKITEKLIQCELHKIVGGQMEVPVGTSGRIDILSATELIEVKKVEGFKSAIGQLIYYHKFYPNHSMRLHLFGKPIKDFINIYRICDENNIRLTYEST